MRAVTGILMLVALLGAAEARATPRQAYGSGIAGTSPANPLDRASRYFARPEVRDLLEAMARGRTSEEDARRILGDAATIDELAHVRLVRRAPDGLAVDFNFFTADDMRLVHSAVRKYAPRLSRRYLAEAGAFRRLLAMYEPSGVNKDRLAFVLLAGFALNWDSLEQTEDMGLRRPLYVAGSGWRYSFWAAADTNTGSSEGVIWGSSTLFLPPYNFEQEPVDFVFSSFGDPVSDPRMNLPDLLYMSRENTRPDIETSIEAIGRHDETFASLELKQVLGPSRARILGPMLFRLRKGDADVQTLAVDLNLPVDLVRRHARLLTDIGYIEQDGSQFRLAAPVLDVQDRAMLDAVLGLHRRIFSDWLSSDYLALRTELAGLSALKDGVPFESLFTQIWHDIFGEVTRDLSRQGLIADSRAGRPVSPGSIGVVWRRSLYDLDLG